MCCRCHRHLFNIVHANQRHTRLCESSVPACDSHDTYKAMRYQKSISTVPKNTLGHHPPSKNKLAQGTPPSKNNPGHTRRRSYLIFHLDSNKQHFFSGHTKKHSTVPKTTQGIQKKHSPVPKCNQGHPTKTFPSPTSNQGHPKNIPPSQMQPRASKQNTLQTFPSPQQGP